MKLMIDVNLMGNFNVIKVVLPLDVVLSLMIVYLIFEEMKTMLEITKIIMVGVVVKAEEVAKITTQGIKDKTFSIPFEIDGQAVVVAIALDTFHLWALPEVIIDLTTRVRDMVLPDDSWHGQNFTTKSAYIQMSKSQWDVLNPNWNLIWKLKAPKRVLGFLWLVAKDKLLCNYNYC
ncbi:hypothetical protein GQ457_04G015880 [Hibiscus cannabinus]